MTNDLIAIIQRLNPWLVNKSERVFSQQGYIPRIQAEKLLLPAWDEHCLVLVGPRQVGKTTLARYLSEQLLQRYDQLLYLSCDVKEIRDWLQSPLFLQQAEQQLQLKKYILFIDEVQRLESPGLMLKVIVDQRLPIKLIVTGSSQLEIRSKVQEHLTGRQLESLILPISYDELGKFDEQRIVYGCYPEIITTEYPDILLEQLYNNYIKKDIIEFLKMGKPDTMIKLMTLIAHSSGQLVNYNQLATECNTSIPTIQHYLTVLEKTYVLAKISPFVGNKRKEVTSNPIYYFIDNGFRNQALRNFTELSQRVDAGLLVESAVFQEVLKYKVQHYLSFDTHYWRTQSGAEVDFVLYRNQEMFIPVEVKYTTMRKPVVSRGFRSFIQAYKPPVAIYVTKQFNGQVEVEGCQVHFIAINYFDKLFLLINKYLS